MSDHIQTASCLKERSLRITWFQTAVHRLEDKAPNKIQRVLVWSLKFEQEDIVVVKLHIFYSVFFQHTAPSPTLRNTKVKELPFLYVLQSMVFI